MARPKLSVTRDRQLNVSLTMSEYAVLRARSEALGQRVSSYARTVLMSENRCFKPDAPSPRYDRLIYHQWARVGANLNQVARRLHTFDHAAVADIEIVLAELRELMRRTRP